MYLVDTNVWLERLLDQQKSEEVGQFIEQFPSDLLFITDFAFHSISVILCRLDRREALLRFVQDAFIDGSVTLIELSPDNTPHIVHALERFDLDFDDTYQYLAAQKYDLTLISFDSDFDRTERGRKTPAEVLAQAK